MDSNYEYSTDRMHLGSEQKYIIMNDSCLLIVHYIVFQNLNIIRGNSVTKISQMGVISWCPKIKIVKYSMNRHPETIILRLTKMMKKKNLNRYMIHFNIFQHSIENILAKTKINTNLKCFWQCNHILKNISYAIYHYSLHTHLQQFISNIDSI